MRKAILIAFIVSDILILGMAGWVMTRPDTFVVERSATLQAPPAAVFALINNLRAWPRWSPWEQLDPGMQRFYGGPDAGTGAIYRWKSDKGAGAGRITLIESDPPRRIVCDLNFTEPFAARNTATFTLTPAGDATLVHWEMRGKNTLPGKIMALFVDMDRLVGKDFTAGLQNLAREARLPAHAAHGGATQ